MQFELDLTGIISQGNEVPLTRKMLEGPIYKNHINCFGPMIHIARVKKLINALKANIDFGVQNSFSLLKDFHSATPWKKLRILLYISHQTIHSVG
jgi:hypothetical protein